MLLFNLSQPLIRNFRFGPLTRASYAPPALNTTNSPPEHAPARSAELRRLAFPPSDLPLLLPRNRFLRLCSDAPPSAPDFATAIGVLTRWHRQRLQRYLRSERTTFCERHTGQKTSFPNAIPRMHFLISISDGT